jgi:hypothetical protein
MGAGILGGPSYLLTSKVPYQASPEAWIRALIDYCNPVVGMQWTPTGHPEDVRKLFCYFSHLPAERSLLTISFDRPGMDPPMFVMSLEPGIEWMLFHSVTLQTAPLVTFSAF